MTFRTGCEKHVAGGLACRMCLDAALLQVSEAQEKYAKLAEDWRIISMENTIGPLWVSGWNEACHKIAESIRGRDDRIKSEKQNCADCPPEKDCMKYNACTCECHLPRPLEKRKDEPRGACMVQDGSFICGKYRPCPDHDPIPMR